MSPTPSISHYIKEIGRGKEGARSLTRAQAADLFGLVLDGAVSDLEIGAFCLSMRIKGETRDELMGFIDAAEARIDLQATPYMASQRPIVVIPSYNGARKLPLLTPLLALLLEREGLSVLVHGMDEGLKAVSGVQRVTSAEIFNQLEKNNALGANVAYASISKLSPLLKKLLDVRKVVGLRNSAHSVVKLINPYRALTDQRSVLVTSYTHPEYALSMNEALVGLGATALLLRGTEGEAVADPRRTPVMTGLRAGAAVVLQDPQHGSLDTLPALPATTDAAMTVAYIQSVISGKEPAPAPIALQVQHILKLL
jgi:anthranilate phosphoribosyltransferase